MTPDNLLDVLAAAGAARVTGGRFAIPARADQATVMPTITAALAENLLSQLRDTDFSYLRMGPMDFLRGGGQMPTLDVRAKSLAHKVTAGDIVAYTDDAPARGAATRWHNLSLRWEIGHESDVPAAQRWVGSKPNPRTSNPGRNALALTTVHAVMPQYFRAPPLLVDAASALDNPSNWPFAARRWWFAPYVPISFEAWKAIQWGGPGHAYPAVEEAGQWYESFPATNGKIWYLARAKYLIAGSPSSFLRGSNVPLWI